jgi:hypothetical protein
VSVVDEGRRKVTEERQRGSTAHSLPEVVGILLCDRDGGGQASGG